MIQYLYLGRMEYGEALRLQEELVALRTQGRIGNTLLLLEHPPVLTLGRNANRANILASKDVLAMRGVTLHDINRGGDVTYHGPGQLIGYPIFDLRSLRNPASGPAGGGSRLGPVDFVRLMEEALIRLCAEFGVEAGRICGLTGVWCGLPQGPLQRGSPLEEKCGTTAKDHAAGERKLAAIGIHVSRGVTSHGFAFNVTTDLRDFQLINPCGITDRPVTSLELEIAREVADSVSLPDLESIAHRAARQFGFVFGVQVLAVESLAALRAQAELAQSGLAEDSDTELDTAHSPARFPAEDTPLTVPLEVDRLRRNKPRPVSG